MSTDAEQVSTSASPHGGDSARVEAERNEVTSAGECGQRVRGGRLIPKPTFSEGLLLEVANVIRRHKLPNLNTHLVDCLIFNWHLMKASERLLEMALDHAKRGGIENKLGAYFVQHLEEERGHSTWLFEDLGGTAQSDWNPNVTPIAAATLAGMVMYAVEFIDPVCLLGYMLVMESFPLPADKLDQLEAIYGQKLLRTARYHAEHDVAHAYELRTVIDTLSPPRQRLVRWTATAAATLLGGALQEIASETV